MTVESKTLDALAAVLHYPGADYYEKVRHCYGLLADKHPVPAESFAGFASEIESLPLTQLEEAFTSTFDLNPICCLEVGWHLFGEDYERGKFLVRMREELQQAGVSEEGELPDHLRLLLRLWGRLPEEKSRLLVVEGLQPAVKKMAAGLAGRDSLMQGLVEAVQRLVDEQADASLEDPS